MGVPNSLEMTVQERIAEVAYQFAEARGFISAQGQQDWQEPQRQVANVIREDLKAIHAGNCQCITPVEAALEQRIKEDALPMCAG